MNETDKKMLKSCTQAADEFNAKVKLAREEILFRLRMNEGLCRGIPVGNRPHEGMSWNHLMSALLGYGQQRFSVASAQQAIRSLADEGYIFLNMSSLYKLTCKGNIAANKIDMRLEYYTHEFVFPTPRSPNAPDEHPKDRPDIRIMTFFMDEGNKYEGNKYEAKQKVTNPFNSHDTLTNAFSPDRVRQFANELEAMQNVLP